MIHSSSSSSDDIAVSGVTISRHRALALDAGETRIVAKIFQGGASKLELTE